MSFYVAESHGSREATPQEILRAHGKWVDNIRGKRKIKLRAVSPVESHIDEEGEKSYDDDCAKLSYLSNFGVDVGQESSSKAKVNQVSTKYRHLKTLKGTLHLFIFDDLNSFTFPSKAQY